MWIVKFSPEAIKDIAKFDNGVKKLIFKGVAKVRKSPMPAPDGYGKPLGNKRGNNLNGFFKIKYKDIGIRVVYTLVRDESVMNVIVVSERDNEYCYELTGKLYKKYGDKIFDDIFNEI